MAGEEPTLTRFLRRQAPHVAGGIILGAVFGVPGILLETALIFVIVDKLPFDTYPKAIMTPFTVTVWLCMLFSPIPMAFAAGLFVVRRAISLGVALMSAVVFSVPLSLWALHVLP